MIVRTLSVLAALTVSATLAQGAAAAPRPHGKAAHKDALHKPEKDAFDRVGGFSGRSARLSAIMGPELSSAAPLKIPAKPDWTRPARREADALAGLR